MDETLDERVRAGIAVLDRYEDADWRERVDLRRLEFPSLTNCVLGQLHGGYHKGVNELRVRGWVHEGKGWPDDDLKKCGFVLGFGYTEEYDDLTEAWKRLLQTEGATE